MFFNPVVGNHPTEYRSILPVLYYLSDGVVRENDYGSIVVQARRYPVKRCFSLVRHYSSVVDTFEI